MTKKKICVVTGTRAEYGLLYWLMKGLKDSSSFELQVIVTGAHLSPEYGYTYKEVEKDFTIQKKIEILMSSDTSVGVSKAMGLGMISFSEAFDDLQPDLVVLLGDRYEVLSVASAALISRVPIAHLHGGEVTEGAFDEAIRHSVTKMSHLHFVATEVYRSRVIQLGENPVRVFNVGGLGIENIKKLSLMTQEEFESSIGFSLGQKTVIVTFHPVTLEIDTAEVQFQALLDALDVQKEMKIIFTKANADTNGRVINRMIDEYVLVNSEKSIAFTSLGFRRYLSGLQFVDAIVGNSSSGLLEAPSFNIGTIDIGDRQRGRIRAESVINCQPTIEEIDQAFKTLYSDTFQRGLKEVQSPYGDGECSERILKIFEELVFDNLLKKSFYDLKGII